MGELKEKLGALEKTLFILPRDNLSKKVLSPAFSVADSVRIQSGYFSSASFAEVALGLSVFLNRSDAVIKMIISPDITPEDYAVLSFDEEAQRQFCANLFSTNEETPNENQLAEHSLKCFAWLLAENRLEIKVCLMKGGAKYHPKIWLFTCGSERVAVHGSMNVTGRGLSKNKENIKVSMDWRNTDALEDVDVLEDDFATLWRDEEDDISYLFSVPDAVKKEIVRVYKTDVAPVEPSNSHSNSDISELKVSNHEPQELTIPPHLVYETGDFCHQGAAVKAWEETGRRGMLEMATGSGKTITSLIAAARLQKEINSLLVVIAAPFVPLIEQWMDEVKLFSVRPINIGHFSGEQSRTKELRRIGRLLDKCLSRCEVILVSHRTLKTEAFRRELENLSAPKLLIADECHNLGVESFVKQPPEFFEYRLGLSATPIRQYDLIGTMGLQEFFGESCFEFSIDEAIGKCLTGYDYFVHFVYLNAEESDDWLELSKKISSFGWKIEAQVEDPALEALLRQRRIIVENCDAKIELFERLVFAKVERFSHTLVYCSAKVPAQLLAVNSILRQNDVDFHQLTEEETSNPAETKQILKNFMQGDLSVLTAKKVLDEGVNVPQIQEAYLLASSTVKREWVQRRGRLLRKCEEIGKEKAVIHDFVVLPQLGALGSYDKRLVKSEYDRVWEFARHANNFADKDGPLEALNEMDALLGV